MWRHYVYQHLKADTGEVFYVGKGSVRKNKKHVDYERAYCYDSRNTRWQRTVAKHGLHVEIVASFSTDIDAQEFERKLIAHYGRKRLVNLTDGGDGHAGIIYSERTRKLRSDAAKRPRSPAWIYAIRAARVGGGNGGVVKRGDKLPESWCKAISVGQSGPNNYMRGRTGSQAPNRREVINLVTGCKYPTVESAAKEYGMKMKTLYNRLSGHRPNPTQLRFA